MKTTFFAASIIALLIPVVAGASTVTVEFEIDIIRLQNSAYQVMPFEPILRQYGSVTFEDQKLALERYTSTDNIIMQRVVQSYGVNGSNAGIVSPIDYLIPENPIADWGVSVSSRAASSLSYSLAPPDYSTVSFAYGVGISTTTFSNSYVQPPFSYEGESWERSTGFYSPIEYLGNFDQDQLESFEFEYSSLANYFVQMQSDGVIFSFSDGYTYSNRPSLLSSGFTWSGDARIVNVFTSNGNQVSEPSTFVLMALGALALMFSRIVVSPKLRRGSMRNPI